MSLFKRLLNKTEDAKSPGTPPAGMQTMGVQLQRRFAKGVQYNSEFWRKLLGIVSQSRDKDKETDFNDECSHIFMFMIWKISLNSKVNT